MRRRRLCVAIPHPTVGVENPYLKNLVQALQSKDCSVESIRLSPTWVLSAARRVDVLHIHWPEYLVEHRTAGLAAAVLNLLRLCRVATSLLMCRLVGIRLVWTVHNLRPHDRRASLGGRALYPITGLLANALVVHTTAAGARARNRWWLRARKPVVTSHHGNYDPDFAPSVLSKSDARELLGLPTAGTLLLAFGNVKPYKRLEWVLQTMHDAGPHLHLLIAGAPRDRDYESELHALAQPLPNVTLDFRQVPDSEVPVLFAASDWSILNYDEVFSSGALLLSLTLGTPVLCRASAAATELAAPPAISQFDDRLSLTGAIGQALTVAEGDRRAAARSAAERFPWSATADSLLDRAYKPAWRPLGRVASSFKRRRRPGGKAK